MNKIKLLKTYSFLKVIEQGLDIIWSNKTKPFFPEREIRKKKTIISDYQKNLYILSQKPIKNYSYKAKLTRTYFLYEIKHHIKFKKNDFGIWYSGISNHDIFSYLPKNIQTKNRLEEPIISGPIPSLFLKYHLNLKNTKRPFNPYVTTESFKATLVHEFAHAYFDHINPPWHGYKKDNMKKLKTALDLFSKKQVKSNIKIYLTPSLLSSEVFAFCCEYYLSENIWPEHKTALDKEIIYYITQSIKEEQLKDLSCQNSVLDQDIHLAAAIYAKLIITKYQTSWPKKFNIT